MSNLNFLKISKKKSLIIGIAVFIAIIIIVLAIIFTKSKDTNNTNNTNDNSKTEKINLALERAGVIVPKENFQNNTTDKIVFDSSDKIIRNFDLFINTFFPSLNSTEMNNMLKKYGVPKTMQELLIENINLPRMFNYISMFANISDKFIYLNGINYKTGGTIDDTICAMLGAITIFNSFNLSNGKIYYLNDYKESGDFNIYFTPISYDISKVISMKSEIPELVDYNDKSQYVNKESVIKPYKIKTFNFLRNKIKRDIIINKHSKYIIETSEYNIDESLFTASEQEIDQILQSFKENRESFMKYFRLYLIKDLIILHTKQYFTESSQIIKDTIELVTPANKYFNENIYQYENSRNEDNEYIRNANFNIYNNAYIHKANDILNNFNVDTFQVI